MTEPIESRPPPPESPGEKMQEIVDSMRSQLRQLKKTFATYRVQPGDTFSSIAKKLTKERGITISVKALESLNSTVDPRKLHTGQRITVPQSQPPPPSTPAPLVRVPAERTEAKEKNESLPNTFVARVIFSEAGSEVSDHDRELIANVIRNRIGKKGMLRGAPPLPEDREPTTADQMEQVVRTPHAFSCIGDANNTNWERSAHPELMKGKEKEAWEHALRLSTGTFAVKDTSVVFYHDRYHWVTAKNKALKATKGKTQRVQEEIKKPKSWDNVVEVPGISDRFKFYKQESRV